MNRNWGISRDGGNLEGFQAQGSLLFRRYETVEIIPVAANLWEKLRKAFAILEIGINGKGGIAYTI